MRERDTHLNIVKGKNNNSYYRPAKYPEIPLDINDIYVTTVAGDRLDLIAHQFYGDVRLWWIIASANMNVIKRDSFILKPGLEIRIPNDTTNILLKFEDLNQQSNINLND